MGTLDLDRAATLHGAAFTPLGERAWTHRDMAELLASPGVAGVLLERARELLGLALWRTAADEAELLTIAIGADCRREGFGRMMLAAVIERAAMAGTQKLFLEVAEDNAPARALYSQAGFEPVGRRAGYYKRPAGLADALVLRLILIGDG